VLNAGRHAEQTQTAGSEARRPNTHGGFTCSR